MSHRRNLANGSAVFAILTVARMTFIEARRNRILWSIVFFCLVTVFSSFLFQELSVGAYDRVLRDAGIGALSIFATFLSMFLGAAVVSREMERRTLHATLCKPITRTQYLVGKILGVWITQAICVSLMFVALLLECLMYKTEIDAVLFQAVWLVLVEQLVVASFAVLGSTFLPTATSTFMTVSMYFAGHMSSNVLALVRKSKSELAQLTAKVVFLVLPDLERFNLKGQVAHMDQVAASVVAWATLLGAAYAVAFTLVASVILQRRDLR